MSIRNEAECIRAIQVLVGEARTTRSLKRTADTMDESQTITQIANYLVKFPLAYDSLEGATLSQLKDKFSLYVVYDQTIQKAEYVVQDYLKVNRFLEHFKNPLERNKAITLINQLMLDVTDRGAQSFLTAILSCEFKTEKPLEALEKAVEESKAMNNGYDRGLVLLSKLFPVPYIDLFLKATLLLRPFVNYGAEIILQQFVYIARNGMLDRGVYTAKIVLKMEPFLRKNSNLALETISEMIETLEGFNDQEIQFLIKKFDQYIEHGFKPKFLASIIRPDYLPECLWDVDKLEEEDKILYLKNNIYNAAPVILNKIKKEEADELKELIELYEIFGHWRLDQPQLSEKYKQIVVYLKYMNRSNVAFMITLISQAPDRFIEEFLKRVPEIDSQDPNALACLGAVVAMLLDLPNRYCGGIDEEVINKLTPDQLFKFLEFKDFQGRPVFYKFDRKFFIKALNRLNTKQIQALLTTERKYDGSSAGTLIAYLFEMRFSPLFFSEGWQGDFMTCLRKELPNLIDHTYRTDQVLFLCTLLRDISKQELHAMGFSHDSLRCENWPQERIDTCIEFAMLHGYQGIFEVLYDSGRIKEFHYGECFINIEPSKHPQLLKFAGYFPKSRPILDKFNGVFDHRAPPRNPKDLGPRVVNSAQKYIGRLHWVASNQGINNGRGKANDFVLMFGTEGTIPEDLWAHLLKMFQNAKGPKPSNVDEPSLCCWEYVTLSLLNAGILTPEQVLGIYSSSNQTSAAAIPRAFCNDNLEKYKTPEGVLPKMGDICLYKRDGEPQHAAIYYQNERVFELIGDNPVMEGNYMDEKVGIPYHIPIEEISANVDQFLSQNPPKKSLKDRVTVARKLQDTKYREHCEQYLSNSI